MLTKASPIAHRKHPQIVISFFASGFVLGKNQKNNWFGSCGLGLIGSNPAYDSPMLKSTSGSALPLTANSTPDGQLNSDSRPNQRQLKKEREKRTLGVRVQEQLRVGLPRGVLGRHARRDGSLGGHLGVRALHSCQGGGGHAQEGKEGSEDTHGSEDTKTMRLSASGAKRRGRPGRYIYLPLSSMIDDAMNALWDLGS